MTPAMFFAVLEVETRKILGRIPAKLGLLVSAAIGVGVPGVLFALKWTVWSFIVDEAGKKGQPGPAWEPVGMDQGLIWSLELRNFFVMAAFLVLLTSVSFAGEYQSRTLREDLLRPIPRWALLLAKWLAMVGYIAAGALVTWLTCVFTSFVLLRGDGDLIGPSLAMAVSVLSDASFAALVLWFAVVTRSVPGSIAGMLLFYVVDYILRFALTLGRNFPMLPEKLATVIDWTHPFLPSSSFAVWRGYDDGWAWQGFFGITVIATASLLSSMWSFKRLDVP